MLDFILGRVDITKDIYAIGEIDVRSRKNMRIRYNVIFTNVIIGKDHSYSTSLKSLLSLVHSCIYSSQAHYYFTLHLLGIQSSILAKHTTLLN